VLVFGCLICPQVEAIQIREPIWERNSELAALCVLLGSCMPANSLILRFLAECEDGTLPLSYAPCPCGNNHLHLLTVQKTHRTKAYQIFRFPDTFHPVSGAGRPGINGIKAGFSRRSTVGNLCQVFFLSG